MDIQKYYETLFPYRQFFLWLNHAAVPTRDFTHREFAFTVLNGQGSDIYVRYQSFPTIETFKRKVAMLTPKRFEIGAVYTAKPSDHKLVSPEKYVAVNKELVFDLDLSDYDSFRTCCQGKQVCLKCWQFVVVAMDVLGAIFDLDFGYKHILWAFSGRRGVHAWVCDTRARSLDDSQRGQLLNYIQVTQKYEKGKVVINRPWHPSVQRSFDICKVKFDQIVLQDQNPWNTHANSSYLLNKLKQVNEALYAKLNEKWQEPSTSREKWMDIDQTAREIAAEGKLDTLGAKVLLETKQDIVLEFLYPKLDTNVSISRQHLLKSPFCVHPDTGNVCVPINPLTSRTFDPTKVPTLATLADSSILEPYLSVFKQSVTELNRSEKRPSSSLDF